MGAVLRVFGLGASRLSYDESFTAMVGRLPLGSLFSYLRANDSHPPLDYLFRAPLARVGTSEFWFRAPSVVCSIAALSLFAWWLRDRGRMGVIATALFAINTFQIVHGREARMYAEMELVGVAVAVLADAWLRRTRRWHAPAISALVLIGLLTHVSMLFVGVGLFALAGRRTDRDAWRWRAALTGAFVIWAIVWGPSFVIQAQGGHSDWIAPTTPWGLVSALGRLVSSVPPLYSVAVAAIILGGMTLHRRAPTMFRLWIACFVIPVAAAAGAGLFVPVILDRTFTVVAWAPVVAVAWLIDDAIRRTPRIAVVGLVAVVAVTAVATVTATNTRTFPDAPLRRLERVAMPGDVVVIHPASKQAELAWSLGVRGQYPTHPVRISGLANASALAVGDAPTSGNIWLLDWWHYPNRQLRRFDQCAPPWHQGETRILCLNRHR